MIFEGFEQNKGILNGRRMFLVCRGSFDRLAFADYNKSLRPVCFSSFTPNPKMEEVKAGAEIYADSGCETILAIGGGSAIDVAKCIKHFSKSGAPIIAIPTTSGTGSESTHFAVVYEDGKKKSIAAANLLPEIVILEPSVLKTVPEYTRKATMLDAVCHAVESHWAKQATNESRYYAEEAIRQIIKYKDQYLENENDGNAGMLRAANLAGQAINISTTTAAHAMCYKITSMYGFQHGHAAAICLSEVWKCIDDDFELSRDEFIRWLIEMDMLKYPETDSVEEDVEMLTKSVNIQRLSNSPVQFTEDQLRGMYRNIVRQKK